MLGLLSGGVFLNKWIKELFQANVATIIENEPLSKHTTWKIGGPADAYIIPNNRDGLVKIIEILNSNKVKWKVLGKGSNLLVSDKGYRGAIISLQQEGFRELDIDQTTINVGADFSLVRLANLAAKNGLTGLEFAGGIPGTVGGAIYMNAGAHNSDISNILIEAEVLNGSGIIESWSNKDFEFSYRHSKLQECKGIIISATFNLSYGDRKIIAEKMASYKDRRRRTQPYNLPCAGSVFRNPKDDYAGRLIEELGLKGYKIGDAQVSTLHSNFIVNTGNATAKDIIDLIEYIRNKVIEAYNIELTSEVELIGEL